MRSNRSLRAALLAAPLSVAFAVAVPGAAAFARDDLSDARASIAKGDLRTAQIQLRNAVRDDPNNAEARYQLGRVSMQLGDPVAAEREARAALDRGYDVLPATQLLIQAMLGQGKARDLLNEIKPDGKSPTRDAAIDVGRGFAHLALQDLPSARADFETAEKTAPNAIDPLLADSRLSLAMRDLPRARQKLDRALEINSKSPEALIQKSQLQRADGDTAGALKTLDQVIAANPDLLPPRINRAELLIAENKDADAKKDVDAVLTALPGSTQAVYLRAVLLFRAHDLQGASDLLQKLSPVMASLPRAYFLDALVKEEMKQYEQAEQSARRALARSPGDIAVQKLLAVLDMQLQQPERAIEVLRATADSPNADAGSLDLIARAYAATGNQAEAVKYFQRAATLAPADAALRSRLATSRLGLGEADQAANDFEKSFELEPKQERPAAQLFFADLATGDLKRTADTFEKIKAAQGDTPLVRDLQGQLQLSQLDMAGARKTFESLVHDHPDFVAGEISLARLDLMEGRNSDAEALLTSVLDATPNSEPALTMLVQSDLAQNKNDAALAVLKRAHDKAPNDARLTASLADVHTRAGDTAGALALLADPKLQTDTNVTLLGARARAQVAAKDEAGALATFRAIVDLNPRDVAARRVLAGLLLKAGNAESARSVLEGGMKADPRNIQLVQDYVGVDLKTGGLDAALATADRLAQNAPDVPGMEALRGDVYLIAKKPDQALKAYQAAMAKKPTQLLLLRIVNADGLLGKQDDAIATLKTWYGAHPDDLVAGQALASLAISAKRPDDAIPLLNDIVAKSPRDAVALNNLAWLLQEKNDPRALDLAKKAYVLQPGQATADTLGWILISHGESEKGLELLRQAAVGQMSPQIAYHLAVALKNTGKQDEAVKLLTALTKPEVQFDEKPEAEKLLSDLTKKG